MSNVTKVSCVQASRCMHTGKEIFTLEMEYPRVVHAQLLTHGVFSKCSSSTRAVPLEAAIKQVLSYPAKYVWTLNQAGMQGEVLTNVNDLDIVNKLMGNYLEQSIANVRQLAAFGIHKQNAGRLLEPFQNIKIVLTSTEWENWDWLRLDSDAQGEIADLARAMKEARDTAGIMELKEGEWHVPYVERGRDLVTGTLHYFGPRNELPNGKLGSRPELTAEEAKQISSSVCAQTSYRKADASVEKAGKMKGMLIDGRKVHASPFEHQATPVGNCKGLEAVNIFKFLNSLPLGVTHVRRDGEFGSGNFIGWIQHRQLIAGHDAALSSDIT